MRPHRVFLPLFLISPLFCLTPLQAQDEQPKGRPVLKEDNRDIPVTVGADGWLTYTNPRFGMKIEVPPGFKILRSPDNGDGQRFISPDEKVVLTVYGSFNVDKMGYAGARWDLEMAEEGRVFSYKKKGSGWFVISGVESNGRHFYQRYDANKKYCAGWLMTYSADVEQQASEWIKRIAKSYRPRLGKGVDTIED